MYIGGWSLRRSSGQWNTPLGQWKVFIKTESVTATQRGLKDVIFLVAELCNFGYRNVIKKDQWTVNHKENTEGRTATVNKVTPEIFLRNELLPRQLDLLCVKQDAATIHTAQISTQVLSAMFAGRLIPRFEDFN
jgi:hypothetical protein